MKEFATSVEEPHAGLVLDIPFVHKTALGGFATSSPAFSRVSRGFEISLKTQGHIVGAVKASS